MPLKIYAQFRRDLRLRARDSEASTQRDQQKLFIGEYGGAGSVCGYLILWLLWNYMFLNSRPAGDLRKAYELIKAI